uniref:Centrosomal protein of 55 kDa n=1 Tax=Nothoprocta perdicaria TaxID=30464 RepID=A0A8C6ZQM2_NOTPE
MTAKGAKEVVIGKWVFKLGSPRAEEELERRRRDSAALRRGAEELAEGKSNMTGPERERLLEKILSLETEKEKNNRILGQKDKEIQNLKDKLKSKTKNSEVSSLLSQLEEKTKEAEKREQLLNSLSEEMDRLKCNLAAVTAKCSELENRAGTFQPSQVSTEQAVMDSTGSPTDLNEVENQLKDALEKNQQWLLYDQQREAYVRGLLGRIFELEQKSEVIYHQHVTETSAEGPLQEKQKYYDQLLLSAKSDLETERRTITLLKSELNELKKKYEETQREIISLNALLQSQQVVEMKTLENENKIKGDKLQRLKEENEIIKEQLREEKKKSDGLLSQVQLLHKSLLKQQEEHTRIALLEQQIQMCTTDFENEKLDRQNLQHQLNKVLKELRKAFYYPFEEKMTVYDTSPSLKRSNLLDESFLECPRCKMQYPTSQHRELLAHIDFCTA